VAAVIKELSSHLGDGIGAILSNWSPYVLVVAGAATMLLASHALAAGPLAASQPGFTILDPFSASLLGPYLFSEHIKAGVLDLAGEALALSVVIAGVTVLSHSHLIVDDRRIPGTRRVAAEDETVEALREVTRESLACRNRQRGPRSTPGAFHRTAEIAGRCRRREDARHQLCRQRCRPPGRRFR
jgi:hypothetical protein